MSNARLSVLVLCVLTAACLPDDGKPAKPGPSAARIAQQKAERFFSFDIQSRSAVFEKSDAGRDIFGPINMRNTDFQSAYCKTDKGDMHISYVKAYWVEQIGVQPIRIAFGRMLGESMIEGEGKNLTFKDKRTARIIDKACLSVDIPKGAPVIAGAL